MRDLANAIQLKRCISPVAVTGNSAQVGQIIDRRGYDSLTYLIALGALDNTPSPTFTVLLEEGDDSGLSDAAAVADADLISQTSGTAPETAAGFTSTDDNEVRKLGYTGTKRYTRLTITPATNDDTAYMAAVAILGHPHRSPVTQATA